MITLVTAVCLFMIVVFCHLLYCRASVDKRLQAKVFIVTAFVCWVMWAIFSVRFNLFISASVIYFLCIPVYLVFYVSTVLTSPSKKILLSLSKENIVSYDSLLEVIQRSQFVETRLQELMDSGCVFLKDGRYVLSPSGKTIAEILNVYQVILGRSVGG